MSTFVYYQLYIFLATFYGGVVIGFMYDVYKIYRTILQPNKIVAIIQDLLFWIVISGVAIHVLVYSNDGQLRAYSLLGFMVGALIYNLLLSRIVVKTINKVLKTIRGIIHYVYNKIRGAFIHYIKLLIYPLKKVRKTLEPIIIKIRRIRRIPNRILQEIRKYSKMMLEKK
ncbi:spore cortex biosynthesis protein YabQ [Wukongibacter baidiensis]|uniref:spore cortex biosynthesis protein YabQ n=1 Tax=Wukongibacter baidiensis TaxID=1723361 RepID=UPI003D7F7062